MWGTLNMPKAILLDRKCWLEHMMLDPKTGLDPPGYKLRASPGIIKIKKKKKKKNKKKIKNKNKKIKKLYIYIVKLYINLYI